MTRSELETVLIRLKGTSKLLTALCDEPQINENNEGRQEALFRVEELLKSDVAALEQAINAD